MTCIVKQCRLCGADFVDKTRSSNKSFCSVNHKSTFNKRLHKDTIRIKKAEYYQRNKDKISASHLRWLRSKFKAVSEGTATHEDLNVVLRIRVRTRLLKSLRNLGVRKESSVVKLLGCSIDELRAHLESKFAEGMDWSNRSEWHIDHIIPLSSFDLSDPEQLAEVCHYTNLQPLWARDNIIKSDRISREAE